MNLKGVMEGRGIIFSAGVLVGSAIGGLLTYHFLVKKKLEELDLAIEECNKELSERDKKLDELKKEVDEAHEAAKEVEILRQYGSYGSDLALTVEEYKKLRDGGPKKDYSRIHPGSSSADPADLEHPEEDYEEDNASDDDFDKNEEDVIEDPEEENFKNDILDANYYAKERRPPKMISSEAFEYDGRGIYDKEDLYYYVYDDTLATEDEEIVADADYLIGDALDKYGFRTSDEDEIYVRNFSMTTDYRITKMFASYSGKDYPEE